MNLALQRIAQMAGMWTTSHLSLFATVRHRESLHCRSPVVPRLSNAEHNCTRRRNSSPDAQTRRHGVGPPPAKLVYDAADCAPEFVQSRIACNRSAPRNGLGRNLWGGPLT